jgi:hypothetical protein
VQEQENKIQRRLGGLGPGHAAAKPLLKLDNDFGHGGPGSFLGCPPSNVTPKSFKEPGEGEVGGKVVHPWEDNIANQVDNVFSFCP